MATFLVAHATAPSRLPAGLEDRLAGVLSAEGLAPSVRRQGPLALAWCDPGHWPGRSVVERTDGALGLVAGDPVWCVDEQALARTAGMERLVAALWAADAPALEACEGSFSALALDPGAGVLTVAVDKLAVRPVYVARHEGVTYVASALWMLERLQDLPKSCDWVALTETAAFGHPLEDRTAYREVESLAPGTLLRCGPEGPTRKAYWDWRDSRWHGQDRGPGLLDRVERAFERAVDDRLGAERNGLSFLSGGMDSRYIAARLRARGVELHSLNFAPEGSADLVFGRLAAAAMQTRHLEFGHGDAPFAQRKSDAIAQWRGQCAEQGLAWAAGHRLLWSGDGGGVVLGHVYLDDGIAAAARAGGVEAAAAAIQKANKYQVSPHLFASAHRQLAEVPLQGIRQQLQACAGIEPGRACHLFFVLNDQRRHMVSHFENVHRLGFDLHLPFFDGRFIRAVFSGAVDVFIAHRLYNQLFERLPFGLGRVPWQSYPGHVPCPVPYDRPLRRQWSDGWFDAATGAAQRRRELDQTLQNIGRSDFPGQVLSRLKLRAATLVSLWGWADYGYLAGAAEPFVRAARVSAGQAVR
jgi:asparagine synthase (glutamine-hydrolysing)